MSNLDGLEGLLKVSTNPDNTESSNPRDDDLGLENLSLDEIRNQDPFR